jgi:hypothetical protein
MGANPKRLAAAHANTAPSTKPKPWIDPARISAVATPSPEQRDDNEHGTRAYAAFGLALHRNRRSRQG